MSDVDAVGTISPTEDLIASMTACIDTWEERSGPSDAYYAALIELKSALKRLEREAVQQEGRNSVLGA